MQEFFGSKKNGITLISLIITIIVMLILAGVSINAIVGDNGIIGKSMEAAFKTEMQQYLEDTNEYVFEKEAQASEYGADLGSIKNYVYAGDTAKNKMYYSNLANVIEVLTNFWTKLTGTTSYVNVDMKEITDVKTSSYLEHLAVIEGDLTWFDVNENKDSDNIKWCIDLGIKVFIDGYGYVGEDGSYTVGSDGTFSSTINGNPIPSGIACCSPDLAGFNTSCTWYLEYSSVNSAPTYDTLIYKDAPNDWYDYGNKKWANIITTTSQGVSYWTWIPRYQYAVGSDGKLASGANNIMFIDTTKTTPDSGYIIPDSFTFEGKALPGIWVAKYEISEPQYAVGFTAKTTDTSLTITDLTVAGSCTSSDPTENVSNTGVYIRILNGSNVVETMGSKNEDGDIQETVTLPQTTKTPLVPGTKYTIEVTIPSRFGTAYNTVLTKKVLTAAGTVAQLTAPDLSGFNKNNTYYVDCSTSSFTIGNKINTQTVSIGSETRTVSANYYDSTSSDWYDYENNKWANIVTIDNTQDEKGIKGQAAYWTWVPRYEYAIDDKNHSVDTVFISAKQTEPDDGYIIPDAFTFGGENLAGIWVAKYECQDIAIPSGFTTKAVANGFVITSLSYEGSSTKGGMPDTGTVQVFAASDTSMTSPIKTQSGVKVNSTEVTGLSAGSYIIKYQVPLAFGDENGNTQYKNLIQNITVPSSIVANEPDLSGFSSSSGSYVYYVDYTNTSTQYPKVGNRVTWDASGNVTSTAPTNWYDYTNKKWANIIVSDEALTTGTTIDYSSLYTYENITMWVWIPRYQYKIDNQAETLYVTGTSSANSGFEIPDSFTFSGKELTGIWVSKYEVADAEVK